MYDITKLQQIEDQATQRFPFLIAYPVQEMRQERNPLRRLQVLLGAFSQCMRYVGLINTCDYLLGEEAPAEAERRRLSNIVESLRRPTLGLWVEAAVNMVAPLLRVRQKAGGLFLREWPEQLKQLQRVKHPGCVRRSLDEARIDLPALDALLELRNVLAHGGKTPSDAESEALIEHYRPLLAHVLDALVFLADYPLFRIPRFASDHVEVMRLHGSVNRFPLDEVRHSCLLALAEQRPQVVLVQSALDRALVLYPFFLDAEDSALPPSPTGFSESCYLYEGYGGKKIYYLGVQTKRERTEEFAAVRKLLAARSVSLDLSREQVTPWAVREVAADVTQETLRAFQGTKYFPEHYQPRPRIESLLDRFLDADEPATGFVLTGGAGVGKTSLLCHTAARWASDPAAPVVVLLAGNQLEGQGRGNVLFATLHHRLCLPADVTSLSELLACLEARRQDDQVPGRMFLLIVDAVNEALDTLDLLREIQALVQAGRLYRWFKAVFAFRQTALDRLVLKSRRSGQTMALFEDARPFFHVARDGPEGIEQSPTIPLDVFSAGEAEQAYERPRTGTMPAFERLSPTLRKLVRHPLLLRFLARAWGRGSGTEPASAEQVFAGVDAQLLGRDPQLPHVLRAMVLRLLKQGSSSLPLDLCDRIRSAWEQGKSFHETLILPNPIEALLEEGILVESVERDEETGLAQSRFAFAHQRYLEHRLCPEILAGRPLGIAPLREALEKRARGDHFPEFDGALVLLLAELAVRDPALAAQVLTLPRAEGLVQRTLFHLARETDAPPFTEPAWEQVCRVLASGAGLELLEELMFFLEKLADAAHWAGVERILRVIGSAPSTRENVAVLARALSLRGRILTDTGSALEGVECCRRAVALIQPAGPSQALARSLNRLGWALVQCRQLQEAEPILVHARDTFRSCGDSDGEMRAVNNLGTLACRSGDLDRAVSCYEVCRETSERERNALGLAHAHNNLGVVRADQKQHAEAEEHYRRAAERCQAEDFANLAGIVYQNWSLVKLRANQHEEAERLLRRSVAAFREPADLQPFMRAHCHLAALLRQGGRQQESEDVVSALLRKCTELGRPEALLSARMHLATAGISPNPGTNP